MLPERATARLPGGLHILVTQQAAGFHQIVFPAIHTLLTQKQTIMTTKPERLRGRMVLARVIHYDAPKAAAALSGLGQLKVQLPPGG